jgi:hypothetical protein
MTAHFPSVVQLYSDRIITQHDNVCVLLHAWLSCTLTALCDIWIIGEHLIKFAGEYLYSNPPRFSIQGLRPFRIRLKYRPGIRVRFPWRQWHYGNVEYSSMKSFFLLFPQRNQGFKALRNFFNKLFMASGVVFKPSPWGVYFMRVGRRDSNPS